MYFSTIKEIVQRWCCHFFSTPSGLFFPKAHTKDATWPNCSHVTVFNSLQMSKSCNPTEQSCVGTQSLCATCVTSQRSQWSNTMHDSRKVSWKQSEALRIHGTQLGLCFHVIYFFSLQRLHLWGSGARRPSFGRKKRKQMASRRRRGQRGVRPRLRPKTGVSPPCLVNNQIQSLWLPIPLPVWG